MIQFINNSQCYLHLYHIVKFVPPCTLDLKSILLLGVCHQHIGVNQYHHAQSASKLVCNLYFFPELSAILYTPCSISDIGF